MGLCGCAAELKPTIAAPTPAIGLDGAEQFRLGLSSLAGKSDWCLRACTSQDCQLASPPYPGTLTNVYFSRPCPSGDPSVLWKGLAHASGFRRLQNVATNKCLTVYTQNPLNYAGRCHRIGQGWRARAALLMFKIALSFLHCFLSADLPFIQRPLHPQLQSTQELAGTSFQLLNNCNSTHHSTFLSSASRLASELASLVRAGAGWNELKYRLVLDDCDFGNPSSLDFRDDPQLFLPEAEPGQVNLFKYTSSLLYPTEVRLKSWAGLLVQQFTEHARLGALGNSSFYRSSTEAKQASVGVVCWTVLFGGSIGLRRMQKSGCLLLLMWRRRCSRPATPPCTQAFMGSIYMLALEGCPLDQFGDACTAGLPKASGGMQYTAAVAGFSM